MRWGGKNSKRPQPQGHSPQHLIPSVGMAHPRTSFQLQIKLRHGVGQRQEFRWPDQRPTFHGASGFPEIPRIRPQDLPHPSTLCGDVLGFFETKLFFCLPPKQLKICRKYTSFVGPCHCWSCSGDPPGKSFWATLFWANWGHCSPSLATISPFRAISTFRAIRGPF